MDVYDKSLVTMLACTTIFFVLAIPLIARKVPRNRIYGFRTRTTLSAETLWFDVNAYFGRRLLVASVFSALGVIVLYYTSLAPEWFIYSGLAALTMPALAAALDTSLYIRRIRKSTNAPLVASRS